MSQDSNRNNELLTLISKQLHLLLLLHTTSGVGVDPTRQAQMREITEELTRHVVSERRRLLGEESPGLST
jgi:hypothetical protein